MSENVVKRLRLTKESADYIEEYANENNIPHDNRTINHIIMEHKNIESKEKEKQSFVRDISENISKEIKKEMKRLLLGVNNTDRNTQIIIELMNGMLIDQDIKDIITTEDVPSQPVTTAKETVQKRIEHLQQKRAEYYKQGGH